jgi:hypothetical protein
MRMSSIDGLDLPAGRLVVWVPEVTGPVDPASCWIGEAVDLEGRAAEPGSVSLRQFDHGVVGFTCEAAEAITTLVESTLDTVRGPWSPMAFIVADHLVTDVVSCVLLTQEIDAAYRGTPDAGEQPGFAAFAERQRRSGDAVTARATGSGSHATG